MRLLRNSGKGNFGCPPQKRPTNMNTEKFIVKVQLPIFSSDSDSEALVYDEGRTFVEQMPLPKKAKDMMKGEPKSFWWAMNVYDKKRNGYWLELLELAPWQDW